jgi:hypothetical protein
MNTMDRTLTYVEERRRIEAELSRQEAQDQDGSSLKPFHHPAANDVLLGRGHPFQKWPGNTRLHRVVADRTIQYVSAVKRIDKTIIALTILSVINEEGNFIERTENGWLVMNDDSVAKEKICQNF